MNKLINLIEPISQQLFTGLAIVKAIRDDYAKVVAKIECIEERAVLDRLDKSTKAHFEKTGKSITEILKKTESN